MNNKAIFFTFIMFMLGLAIVVFTFSAQRTVFEQKETNIQQAGFDSVDRRFESLNNEILSLRTGYAGRQQARVLAPFDYSSGNIACETIPNSVCPCSASPNGCGFIKISQSMPPEDTINNEIYDALNLYAIFVSDSRQENDLDITATPARNPAWGGTTNENLGYILVPQCIQYNPNPTDLDSNPSGELYGIYLKANATNCTFDASKITKIEAELAIDEQIKIKTSGTGGTGDLSDNQLHAFTGAQNKPYVWLHLKAPRCQPHGSCSVCCLPPDYDTSKEMTIGNYVDLTDPNGLSLKIDVQPAHNYEFYVLHNSYLSGNYLGGGQTPIIFGTNYKPNTAKIFITDIKITLKEPIEFVRFNGFDFEISKPNFKELHRST